MQQQLAVTPTLAEPVLSAALAVDAAAAGTYCADLDAALRALGPRAQRDGERRLEAAALEASARAVKERFFRRHAAAIYDDLTDHGARSLRVAELLAAASQRYPALLPTPEQIEAERALKQQSAKEGLELDQGLFIAQLLADERMRHAPDPCDAQAEARGAGADCRIPPQRIFRPRPGQGRAHRQGRPRHPDSMPNSSTPRTIKATAALETAVDLVLLDDAIEVGVLRGGTVAHPKYAGRRIFNAGINLTHLYYGQISFVDFFIERELGLLHKIYRGHWRAESYDEQFEDYVEKPWIAAVEAFAIGGGCQLLCIMDRVLAETGSYFNLPASKEGFIPGAANLRLPRLTGIKLAREGIFFERVFHADTSGGPPDLRRGRSGRGDGCSDRGNAEQLTRAGMTSAV